MPLRRILASLALAPALAAKPDTRYSFSLSTFSPEGRVQQIEFAFKAVEKGPPAAAVATPEGVVVAKAARAPEAGADVGESPHLVRVTESIVATYAGLPADFRA